jgi:phosphatidylglycerol:prolipoprotein diacylglycerol transferase
MLERTVGRLGCLGAGCCYGIASRLPWAYAFEYGMCKLHPTQAYEMIYALAIFLSSRYLYKKTRDARGMTMYYIIFCYSVFRFFNEFLRQEGPFIYGRIKYSHAGMFALALFAACGLFYVVKRSGRPDESLKALKLSFIRLAIYIVAAGTLVLGGITVLLHFKIIV